MIVTPSDVVIAESMLRERCVRPPKYLLRPLRRAGGEGSGVGKPFE